MKGFVSYFQKNLLFYFLEWKNKDWRIEKTLPGVDLDADADSVLDRDDGDVGGVGGGADKPDGEPDALPHDSQKLKTKQQRWFIEAKTMTSDFSKLLVNW